MYLVHKNNTLNTLILKLLAVLLGYSIWLVMSSSQTITREYSIPLFFYNIPEHAHVVAPEVVTVQLRGTKKTVHSLATEQMAAHIDVQTLKYGDNLITFSQKTLFLPINVELIHTMPFPVVVSLKIS